MSMTFSDQEILDLVGDLASYVGLPGGSPGASGTLTQVAPAAAQHPFFPVQAYLSGSGANFVLAIGGPNQRCMLPGPDNSSNPVTTIPLAGYAQSPSTVITSNSNAVPRIDLLYGSATLTYDASGNPDIGATFTYAEGFNTGEPPNIPPGSAAVAQVVVPALSGGVAGAPSGASVQMVLPSLTFFSVPATAVPGRASDASAIPLLAVVVTAAPFNVPYIQGSAQKVATPTLDAMAPIQKALTFLGAGGCIYIPSGTYGVGTTCHTFSNSLFDLTNVKGKFGQTIIFGGSVQFVALPNFGAQPALVLEDGAVTVGTAKFYDLWNSTGGSTTASITMSGAGASYASIPITGLAAAPITGNIVTIADTDGNQMTAIVTASSTAQFDLTSIGELVDGEFQTPANLGVIASGAVISTPNTSGSYAVQVAGASVIVDSIYTDGWVNGVQITGADSCQIKLVRGRNILDTGISYTNAVSGAVHDNFIGSVYMNSPGGGGQVGFDIYCVSGSPGGSLQVTHIENLGFDRPGGGPAVSGIPSTTTAGSGAIDGVGVCIRGGSASGIQFGEIFNSGCGNGLYLDNGTTDIAVAILHASGQGQHHIGSSGTYTGYSFACPGLTGFTDNDGIQSVYIGTMDTGAGARDKQSNGSANGIYLRYATQVHIGFALISNRNLDGVFLDVGTQSFGVDHLVTQFNGGASGGSFSVRATTGSPGPEFISLGILDASQETASGVLALGSVKHLTFNDLCSVPSGSSSPAYGLFISDGASGSAPGVTIGGTAGGSHEWAVQIANPSTMPTAKHSSTIGTTSAWTLNGVTPRVLQVSNAESSGDAHMLALDDSGNLAIAGAVHLPSSVVIEVGSGAPTSPSPVTGSMYLNTAGASGSTLYVAFGGNWNAVTIP